jgi:hypothetical protein
MKVTTEGRNALCTGTKAEALLKANAKGSKEANFILLKVV